MPLEILGDIGGPITDRNWRFTQIDMAIVYLRGLCGEPPTGATLEAVAQESDIDPAGSEPLTFYALALTWEGGDLGKKEWEYIARCEDALLEFDSVMPWREISPETMCEKLGWVHSDGRDAEPKESV